MSDSAHDLVESAKNKAAIEAVKNHFPKDARYVGIGSGSTIVYVVKAIKDLGIDTSQTQFVSTGYQSATLITDHDLALLPLNLIPRGVKLDIAFDGADEVDEELNCIKGGGACLFQEKLVAEAAKEFICVADYRKLQPRLLTNWKTIPIEVEPISAPAVTRKLEVIGSDKPMLRKGILDKTGPTKTDQGNYIVDAPFKTLLIKDDLTDEKQGNGENGLWEVEKLTARIKLMEGVLSVGIFSGPTGPEAAAAGSGIGHKPTHCYFGMQDGSVTIRKVKGLQ